MFVYQKGNVICVTFEDSKPVEVPDYEIIINEDTKTLTVNGEVLTKATNETEDTPDPDNTGNGEPGNTDNGDQTNPQNETDGDGDGDETEV